ncbi:alpha-1,4-glucan--maltose-1-phosphate maltosyltransferase [Reyranella sp.]|jgi:starch synthase (maltosyl-transferring)|uniref:alpha-1,4-glucan--maltose-1-phosphate maltosyltransferase n=1 Tax=Reyranella sp. TaxID=1929291 RepID=UPI002F91F5B0
MENLRFTRMALQPNAPAQSTGVTSPSSAPSRPAPFKIYYLHPRLAGPVSDWDRHFKRIAGMGFDHVCVAPPFAPGPDGDLFLTGQHDRSDPALGIDGPAEAVVRTMAERAAAAGLNLLADLMIDRVAAAGETALLFPDLFGAPERIGMFIDPRQPASPFRAVPARFEEAETFADWWAERLPPLVEAGLAGFRLLGLERIPASALRLMIEATRRETPGCRFLGWTLGLSWERAASFPETGLDAVFASTPWWDGRASWYIEEHNILQRVAPPIGVAEAPFEERLGAQEPSSERRLALSRRTLQIAALSGGGLLVPMGFEFMTRRQLDPRFGEPADFVEMEREADGDLAPDIGAANSTLVPAAVRVAGEWRALTGSGSPVSVVQSRNGESALCINSDLGRVRSIPVALPTPSAANATLEPGEVRLMALEPEPPIVEARPRRKDALRDATKAPRIVIENLAPRVEGGPFAAKRIVGETVIVEADIFIDGHDVLGAELLWKAADQKSWNRTPMTPLPNDRWQAAMTPQRVGRWLFTVEAWLDELATVRHAMKVKREAGMDVSVEVAEEKELVEAGAYPPFVTRHEPLPLDVERPAAGFASWYELFPRSQTSDAGRHGTFTDVIERLPRIRDMGFDVLYFPPIHPIGTTARKGRNNALKAAPGDLGSPYAIGSAEGGHDAIHRELGGLEDFRRLVAAAHRHGLEIALDFAIQCSPDHPWLKQHPDWFRHRPDGTIKHAENPPKKYEDIVNVDFYASGAVPALWEALRDVVLFWIEQGVKIFRVDNPHTKPLPFWQWMIADVRSRHPDAIFLAEAFTRPKMMYRLAKVGFSQSYTYFTWRNTKHELVEYLTELSTTAPVEFFRPHFFVNTPDINPHFLQTSGRAGFLIRAVLATTTSGLWGMYSGFELCEAAPLPGREEYLDSEKYEIRVRDWNAPGNIAAEITALNRIRRTNPALHSHRGIRFYNATNDQMMVYGRTRSGQDDMILVAVSLDPHHPQETDFELPLWEWKLSDSGSLAAEDLITGHRFTWSGKGQRLRLDPGVLPFAIWRLAPLQGDGA